MLLVLLKVWIKVLWESIVGRSNPRLGRWARHKEWVWTLIEICLWRLLRRRGSLIVRRVWMRVRESIILLLQWLLLVRIWRWWIVVVCPLIEIRSLFQSKVWSLRLLTIVISKSALSGLVNTALINALRWEPHVISRPDLIVIAKHWGLMMLPNLHDVSCLLKLELIFMLILLYFDDHCRLLQLLLFSMPQRMIISAHYSFPWFRLRFFFDNLFFEHLHHFLLFLLLLPLLHHCHGSRLFAPLGFMYFL